MARKLTAKQNLFVVFYLETLNATEAAFLAGYKGNRMTLAAIGAENLRKPHIRAEIDEYFEAFVMSSKEVLARLSQQARADISDFISLREIEVITKDKSGELIDTYTITKPVVNEAALEKKGHLVKKLRETAHGLEIELHDPQAAQQLIGKYFKLFADRHEHVGKDGEPLEITVRYVNADD